MVYRELDEGSVEDKQTMKRGKPTASICSVAICVGVCYIDSCSRPIGQGVVGGHNLARAGIPGSALNQSKARSHVADVQDDVDERWVGLEIRVDGHA